LQNTGYNKLQLVLGSQGLGGIL